MAEDVAEDGGLFVPPPTEYRRMLSWQLSQVHVAPVRKVPRAQKQRKHRQRNEYPDCPDSPASGLSSGPEEDDSDEDMTGEEVDVGVCTYLVVNSEGEEECYYSAPESPTEEEGERQDECVGVSEACLPPQERKRGGRSRKAKKKIRNVVRMAEIEFFGPLCDLVEGSLEVDIEDSLERTNHIHVPSLAELCIHSIQSEKLVQTSYDTESDQNNLPYLIYALLGAHRVHRSIMSTQVRCLERFLATWESYSQIQECCTQLCKDITPPLAYVIHGVWSSEMDGLTPDPFEGMHLPLPFHPVTNLNNDNVKSSCLDFRRHISSLVHFANYLYPVRELSGSDSGGGVSGGDSSGGAGGRVGKGGGSGDSSGSDNEEVLSSSHRAAIAHVNHFLSSRYKKLCEDHSEFLKVWPGYVFWARGHVKLALSAFTIALDTLKHAIDKTVLLNEMGRMMLMFGDRYNASLFFTKSQQVDVLPINDIFSPTRDLVQLHLVALQASIWDCGYCCSSCPVMVSVPPNLTHSTPGMWYLHLAAIESRMMVHAGTPVGSQPGSPLSTTHHGCITPLRGWLCETVELISTLTGTYPVLHYHHSLLLAMDGKMDEARKTFLRFCDRFITFAERSTQVGFPGDPFSLVTNHRLLNPWLPLCNMLNEQGLTTAPIMKLKWRTRLLHPMYPYVHTESINYLADHCSSDINLRLSDTGYVTADIHMDFPPLRSIFLDPYTGSVCFSYSDLLSYYLSDPVRVNKKGLIVPDETALPWPVRLLEWNDDVLVELLIAGCVDGELNYFSYWHQTNQSASLRWQRCSEYCKLDLRLAIRKELKKAVLLSAQQQKIEEKEELVAAMMKKGLIVSADELRSMTDVPSKYDKRDHKVYKRVERKVGKKIKKMYELEKPPERERNRHVKEFNLSLTEYFVFGEATLAMIFSLRPYMDANDEYHKNTNDKSHGQALVLINCTSQESFLKPRIYCVGNLKGGYYNIYPSRDQAASYPSRHLPHVRYMIVSRCELKEYTEMVLDQNGDLVYEYKDSKTIKFTVGERILNWNSHVSEARSLASYDLEMKDCIYCSVLNNTVKDLVPVPGCVLVHSQLGLSLLHPGSLELVGLEYACRKPAGNENGSLMETLCQIPVENTTFSVLSVYNVETYVVDCPSLSVHDSACRTREGGDREVREGSDEKDKDSIIDELQQEERKGELGRLSFGSCCVAVSLNSRLLVLHIPHKSETVCVLMDVVMPGKVTEFCDMGNFGYMVSVSQFPNHFREELYWLSPSGQLRGMLPCLGGSRHSFLSAAITPQQYKSSRTKDNEQCVYFNDGQGAVCCVQLGID